MANVSHYMAGSDWTNPEQTPAPAQDPGPQPPVSPGADMASAVAGAPPAGTSPLPPAASGALDDSGNARVQGLQGMPRPKFGSPQRRAKFQRKRKNG